MKNPASEENFRRIGESKNEVLEVIGSELLKDTFIFKRSASPESLEREFRLSTFLHDCFEGSDEVSEPLNYVTHNGQTYLVLRRVAGRSLPEVFTETTLEELMHFTHNFHTRLQTAPFSIDLQHQDYGQRLREKYLARILRTPLDSTTKSIDFIAEYLKQQPTQIIHGDLHPGNVLRRENGFTIIDQEQMTLAVKHMDLADILESHMLPLGDEEREKALRTYYSLEKKGTSFEEFMLTYSYSAVFKNLWTLGAFQLYHYGLDLKEVTEAKKQYRERTTSHLSNIADISPELRRNTSMIKEILAVYQ